jgi:hypothetical protein
MRILFKIGCCLLLFAPPSLAQYPAVAARAPEIQVGVGYSYFSLAVPSSNRANLSGPTLTFCSDFRPRFGIVADIGYARAANVFGTGRNSDLLTYLAGPVFYPTRRRRVSTYIHGLLGAARITGPVTLTGDQFLSGFANKLAWAVGGGVEYRTHGSFTLRFGADYIHTSYFNSSRLMQGQDNLRTGFSVIYSFGGRSTSR